MDIYIFIYKEKQPLYLKITDVINTNYDKWIYIIKNGQPFKNSPLKDDLNDILNDTLLYILERFSDEELLEKYNQKTKHNNQFNNRFDGLVIYITNLNLTSATSPYFKKYKKLDTLDVYIVDNYIDLDENNYSKINFFEKDKDFKYIVLDTLDKINEKYTYKKEIWKEYYGIDTKYKKKTLEELKKKYRISLTFLSKTINEINQKLKKELEKL